MRPGCSVGDQPAGHLARQDVRPAQVGVEHLVDELDRHLVGPLGVGDAGVVDEDRDRADRLLGPADGGDDVVGVGHVDPQRNGGAALRRDQLGELGEPVLAPAGGDDRGAGGREHLAKRHPSPDVAPVTRATWPVRSSDALGSGKSVTAVIVPHGPPRRRGRRVVRRGCSRSSRRIRSRDTRRSRRRDRARARHRTRRDR